MSWTPTIVKAAPQQQVPTPEQESALDELLDGMEAAGIELPANFINGKDPSATFFAGAYPSEPSPLEE